MNEYDPTPKHVLPLNYATPPVEQPPGSFALGCISSLGLLFGLPIFFANLTNDGSLALFGLGLAAAIILAGIVWAFARGKRAFGRGLIWGPLSIVCLLLLLAGICGLMMAGR